MSIGKIYSSADQLETAIRKRDSAVPALLTAFRSLLDHQVHVIQQALPDVVPHRARSKANQDFQTRRAASAAARLRELLEASDSDATEAFSALSDAAPNTLDKLRLDALAVAISNFDFA